MFHYVYLLKSEIDPRRHYVGMTDDLHQRLALHNAGKVSHTSKFKPWSIDTAIAFSDKAKATAFERYLKSGSGREFSRRHFRLAAKRERRLSRRRRRMPRRRVPIGLAFPRGSLSRNVTKTWWHERIGVAARSQWNPGLFHSPEANIENSTPPSKKQLQGLFGRAA
jgi:putative endonuclease